MERGAPVQIQAYTRTEPQLPGSVLPRRDVHSSAAGLTAVVNGALESRARVILLAAGGAVVFNVEDGLGRQREGASRKGRTDPNVH